MGRVCSDCNSYQSCSQFSSNQWRKGDGYSRCKDCVSGFSNSGGYDSYSYDYFECSQCSRTFNNQNELNMHMQVHRPRNVSCPVCGETRFRSGANAVQHVESGYCTGCRGQDQAREQIYRFAAKQKSMRPFMNSTPMLEYGDGSDYGVPDLPYHCPDCSKPFRHLSQLLQHQDQKHGSTRMISYM
uniref:C2H2-type domain-containing protein n=1 Tax=Entomoneis paludosa TaxID=265537 RepID=A0A7S2YSA1_9STRA|mmetsp:Transcript_777/g.1861  ORF Transcript_777/g.1861 Transcript_777/m.1861 type:complete len:185 (+) Transcript_777:86-640(+)